MATQRVPIFEANAAPQNIAITYSGGQFVPSPASCIILGSGQQSVSFTNRSGSTVSINFVQDPLLPQGQVLFQDINNLPSDNLPHGLTPNSQYPNRSAVYYINVNNDKYGPFAIQVGSGPLYVRIAMSGTTITCTPDPVAVPSYNSTLNQAGTIEMVPDNAANNYYVGWPDSDPFTPPITVPDSQPHSDSPTTVVQSYRYTVNTPNPKQGGNGGGTVKIRGTG